MKVILGASKDISYFHISWHSWQIQEKDNSTEADWMKIAKHDMFARNKRNSSFRPSKEFQIQWQFLSKGNLKAFCIEYVSFWKSNIIHKTCFFRNILKTLCQNVYADVFHISAWYLPDFSLNAKSVDLMEWITYAMHRAFCLPWKTNTSGRYANTRT